MQTVKQVVQVPRPILILLNRWLSEDKAVEESGHDEVLYKATAKFENGIEADIKCVNSASGPYVDAVIFQNGHERACLEPSFEKFHGEYSFELDGQQYIAVVECEK